MINKSKYLGKDFIFINGDFKGQETRCCGVFTSENDGITYLDLNNGMPVPVDQIDYFLKEQKNNSIVNDTIDLRELKEQYEPELLEQEKRSAEQEKLQFQSVQVKQNEPVQNVIQQAQTVNVSEQFFDLFGGFSKTPAEISLNLNVELPQMSLIKAMYENYDDKNDFISKFSAHILASINKDVISSSVIKMLESSDKPKRTKKNNSPELNG